MADIFISYSQKDRVWVKRLVDALTAEGWEVWWDLEIRAGERFDRAIERTLRQVQAVVAVWSENSVDSDWVRDEAAWAQANNKLLTVRIEGQFPLPLKFSQVHAHSMAAWDGARDDPRFRKLVADIVQIAGPPTLPKSGTRPAADQPAAALAKESTSESPLRSRARPASGAASRQEPASGPVSDVPAPRSASGLRTVVVGIGSLVAVGLVGGLVFFGTAREPPPGPEPRAPVAEHEQDAPAASAEPSTPEPAPQTARAETQSDPAPLSTFRDTLQDGSSGPEMVSIPAGEFQMGCVSGRECFDDELPVRTVRFEEPFAIGMHEVTFAEYDRFAEATGAKKPKEQGWGRGRGPVIDVAWTDAAAYCDWLGKQTGQGYRLPSEAQWEYAARAGTATPWSFGDDAAVLDDYGWYSENADRKTHPVGEKRPNPWGLYDMHGNVWEWVQDAWHGSYEGAPDDGTAWESGGAGAVRVFRGGSWNGIARYCRSAFRYGFGPDFRSNYLGFRCARVQE